MLVKGCQVAINMPLADLIPIWIKEILDHLKTQQMCKRQFVSARTHQNLFPDASRPRKCVKKQLNGGHMHWNTSLRSVRPEKYVKNR